MSVERVHEIIDLYGLPEKTSNTITVRNKLLEELVEIRKQGYAVNDEEVERKVKAIAVPILLLDDEIVGELAIDGIAGWMDRMNFETNFPPHLLMKSCCAIIGIHLLRNTKFPYSAVKISSSLLLLESQSPGLPSISA